MALMIQARYWKKAEGAAVRCGLCPHACLIPEGRRGLCGVRENQAGTLMSLNYAKAIAIHDDPIEKKPLFHVLPGSRSLSVATVGCNLTCEHCQNHDISQFPRRNHHIAGDQVLPAEVVAQARIVSAATISFTYSEPTIFTEWAQDIAELAVAENIRCVSVTNGYVASQPLTDSAKNLLAANVDLKSFSDDFYKKVCGASLQPVLDTIRRLHELGVWIEVTTLLIPGLNDDRTELASLAGFIASVDPAIPWHLSRFHPDNEMVDRAATPLATISAAREIGRQKGLRYVYSGNVWGDEGEHTLCPACRQVVIRRHGFLVHENRLKDGGCPDCGERIEGIWQ